MRPHTRSESYRRSRRRLARHPLPLALAIALAPPLAYTQVAPNTLPTDPSGLSGITIGDIQTTGNTMTIAQPGSGAIINWESFSIGSEATMTFNHAVAGGVTLNRVIGNVDGIAQSEIRGALNADNGRVFIVNPSGVLFGAGAQVNVGGLVASTLSISDVDFNAGVISGSFGFGQADESPFGDITVAGPETDPTTGQTTPAASLTAAPGGTLALLGNQDITNGGALTAELGSVIMAQGRQVTLDFFGDGLTQVVLNGDPDAVFATVGNTGTGVIKADGGQVRLVSNNTHTSGEFIILNQGQIRARTLENREGRIVLSGPNGVVDVGGTLDATGTATGQQGGTIEIEGQDVAIFGLALSDDDGTGCDVEGSSCISIDASGHSGGGTITIASAGSTSVTGDSGDDVTTAVEIRSDALAAGSGGTIEIDAGTVLQVSSGTLLSAQAGGSGPGGLVRTASADILDLRGIEVAAGGPGGAGAWEIQSGRGLAIVAGASEFGPPGGVSLVSDDSIGGALRAGTNVDITVPAPATGTAQINVAPGVAIANTGTQPVALSLTAAGGQVLAGIGADGDPNGPWSILSSAGPLDLSIDALSSVGLYQGTVQTNGGAIDLISRNSTTYGIEVEDTTLDSGGGDMSATSLITQDTGVAISGATINTEGGTLTLQALDSGGTGVSIAGSTLDTRIAQDAANAGGAVTIEGNSRGESGIDIGVLLSGSNLRGSTGDIAIIGRTAGTFGGDAAGVSVTGGEILSTDGDIDIFGAVLDNAGTGVALSGGGVLSSGSGAVGVVGIGGMEDGAVGDGSGVFAFGHGILSDGGDIVLSGRGGEDGTDDSGNPILNEGLLLGAGTVVASAGGDILLSGSSEGSGAGVFVSGVGPNAPVAASVDAGAGNIVLRAGNDGSTTALLVNGSAGTSGVVDLRAGEVNATGAATDRNTAALQIGGGTGEFVSMASLANIATPDLVIGHAGHAGAISIAEALARTGNVTLQNAGGAGGIALNAAVNLGSGTLALVSGGNIVQTAAAGITAQSLLARSTGGGVDLTAGQNDVSGNTLAGGAAGDFGYVDVNALAIGDVTAWGFDAVGSAATGLAESGIDSGEAVFVRNNAGDLTLGADVSGNVIDLVTAGRLQNIAGATITASDRWRVWADTWTGEQRGGLAGSGSLPNLYNCSFGGPCGVAVPTADNHFIYRQQPTATIVIGDAAREYGLNNPAFAFDVSGLILGDQAGIAIAGAPDTSATVLSDVGEYAIGGSFSSPVGYAIPLDPGVLAITPAPLLFTADPYSRVYGDPNGVLTGSVSGFRNDQGIADLIGTLVWTTDAAQGSDAGTYAIDPTGVASLNYSFVSDPANATAFEILRATLTYVADPFTRFFGQPNGVLTGTVTGFRNGDTLADATIGTLAFVTGADPGSPPGQYAITGVGLDAGNYAFVQAAANLTALRVDFTPVTPTSVDLIRLPTDSYVYDRNIGMLPMCPVTGPLDGTRQDQEGDQLGREWARVRSRPNLTSCVSSERRNGCGDF
ncbi:beta strand repeat-containing protein [Luteimonas salinilitoris]|uniref:Beta strand repeat-containing protein n=1 Tax=Luteimonas salinilitoris TaxID=3237697 RepID=A0ABV4HUW4_9GAMM